MKKGDPLLLDVLTTKYKIRHHFISNFSVFVYRYFKITAFITLTVKLNRTRKR